MFLFITYNDYVKKKLKAIKGRFLAYHCAATDFSDIKCTEFIHYCIIYKLNQQNFAVARVFCHRNDEAGFDFDMVFKQKF